MKKESQFKSLLMAALLALLVTTLSCKSIAQKQVSADLKEFKITIERIENGLALQSHKGSAWIDLSFTLADDQPQGIDEYGITQLDKASPNKDANLANYLFAITRTKDRIKLTSREGTAWKELSFALPKNKKQTINQFGMTD